MTYKEKLEKLKELADAMYHAAQYLTTDASRLRKTMEDYHQFIIYEYRKEEPVSKEFEKTFISFVNATHNNNCSYFLHDFAQRLYNIAKEELKEPVSEPNKELAETYLAVFNKKFPILPSLSGKQLADYKNFLNKCQQIFGLKEWGIRPIQSKLFEKLTLLWAAWGAEHLQGVGRQDEKEQDIPVSEDLVEAAITAADEDMRGRQIMEESNENRQLYSRIFRRGFKAGAKWKELQFEKNRLKHCNSITNEQAELEQGFIDQHLDKHQRMPTFLDAIEYGMRLQKEHMMKGAFECEVKADTSGYPDIPLIELYDYDKDEPLAAEGDKVKVIVIKEDQLMTREEALEGQRCLRVMNEFMMDQYRKHKNDEQHKKNNK